MAKNQNQKNEDLSRRKPVMTLSEVARRIGKSTTTVSRWAKEGLLPAIRLPSGLPGVTEAVFDEFFSYLKVVKQEKESQNGSERLARPNQSSGEC